MPSEPGEQRAELMTDTADYPTELEGDVMLPNGCVVRIRPLRRCEEAPVRALYDRLSPRTRYLRFFSMMPTLPDYMLRMLACVDYRRRLALIAEHDGESGREIVGLASFGVRDDGNADVGLVVRDDWQQQRLGTELAGRLLQAAEARGFHHFIASVRWDNVAIRTLLTEVGVVVSKTMSGEIVEIAFVRRRTPSMDVEPARQ
jgi:acetyltransferase